MITINQPATIFAKLIFKSTISSCQKYFCASARTTHQQSSFSQFHSFGYWGASRRFGSETWAYAECFACRSNSIPSSRLSLMNDQANEDGRKNFPAFHSMLKSASMNGQSRNLSRFNLSIKDCCIASEDTKLASWLPATISNIRHFFSFLHSTCIASCCYELLRQSYLRIMLNSQQQTQFKCCRRQQLPQV